MPTGGLTLTDAERANAVGDFLRMLKGKDSLRVEDARSLVFLKSARIRLALKQAGIDILFGKTQATLVRVR